MEIACSTKLKVKSNKNHSQSSTKIYKYCLTKIRVWWFEEKGEFNSRLKENTIFRKPKAYSEKILKKKKKILFLRKFSVIMSWKSDPTWGDKNWLLKSVWKILIQFFYCFSEMMTLKDSRHFNKNKKLWYFTMQACKMGTSTDDRITRWVSIIPPRIS